MKRYLVLAVLLAIVASLSARQPSIIENVLVSNVEEKVSSMQELVGFNDAQAQRLRKMELNFLLEVNKTENCFLCNKQKRIKKLKQKRDAELQKILERDQYIKYDAIENERIQKRPLWAN